jgi:hypothetical protein
MRNSAAVGSRVSSGIPVRRSHSFSRSALYRRSVRTGASQANIVAQKLRETWSEMKTESSSLAIQLGRSLRWVAARFAVKAAMES